MLANRRDEELVVRVRAVVSVAQFADQMLGYIVIGILMEQRQGDVT
ncbi:hypothetical protein [Streptomyces sp. NPDC093093]